MSAPIEVPAERLRWGGVDVDTFALSAIDLSGLLALPARRGTNTPVAGRDGDVRTSRKSYGAREFGVEFRLDGCLPDGSIPPQGQARAFYEALDLFGALCAQDVAPLDHLLPDGVTWRSLPVEVIAAVEPSRELHGGHGRAKVIFTSHESWWRGLVEVTDTLTLAAGGVAVLPSFAGSNGRIDDALVTFGIGTTTGNNPTLTHVPSGIGVGYEYSFLAADGLTLGRYAALGSGAVVFDRQKLIKDARIGPWWVLDTGLPGVAPQVRLDLTGGGPMTVSVTARSSWATG